jgi:hypothetical protein
MTPQLINLVPFFAQVAAEPGSGSGGGGLGLLVFGLFSMAFPFLAIVLQVVCIVHVIRNHRDFWWIFLILFFPYVGAIVYFFVEIYPSLKRGRLAHTPYRGGSARRRIRELEEVITYSDTVENRSELAAAYCEVGEFEKARRLYSECLTGLYENDPHLLFGLAKAHYGLGEAEQALKAVERTFRSEDRDYINERRLLRAKALEKLGRNDDALQAYAEIAGKLSGLEGRFRYAHLLAQTGNTEEARRLLNAMLTDAKRMSSLAKRREKKWIQLARKALEDGA